MGASSGSGLRAITGSGGGPPGLAAKDLASASSRPSARGSRIARGRTSRGSSRSAGRGCGMLTMKRSAARRWRGWRCFERSLALADAVEAHRVPISPVSSPPRHAICGNRASAARRGMLARRRGPCKSVRRHKRIAARRARVSRRFDPASADPSNTRGIVPSKYPCGDVLELHVLDASARHRGFDLENVAAASVAPIRMRPGHGQRDALNASAAGQRQHLTPAQLDADLAAEHFDAGMITQRSAAG